MSKHTPGPWDVVKSDLSGWWIRAQCYGQDRGAIAFVGGGVFKPHRELADENAANGRLIAAAPDLLAALKEVVRHLDYHGVLDEGNQAHAQPRRSIRLAIAKAEGA